MHDGFSRSASFDLELPAPSRPRVSTEELTMHVYLEGAWHRRLPDLTETPCEKPIDGQRCAVRREELSGDLCTEGCFTRRELQLADVHNRKEFEP